MKAVVVEKKYGKAIVLDNRGRFHEIKDGNDLVIGQEYERGMTFKVHRRLIAAGVSLAIVFTLGTTGYAYTVPVDYVTLDINPSVELGVNMFGKVVDVNNFNEDGTKLTENLDLKGDTVDKALTELVKEATDQGYLTEENNNSVMVTVATKNEDDAADLQKIAEGAVTKELQKENLPNTEVIAETITKERQKEAKMMGISPGKVLLIQKLKAFNEEIKLEDYANKPVKEIMKEIKSQKSENKQGQEEIKQSVKVTNEAKGETTQESKDSTKVKPDATQEVKENKETKKQEKKEEKKNTSSVKEVIKEVDSNEAMSTDESKNGSNSNIEKNEVNQEDKKQNNKKEDNSNNGKGNENGNSSNSNGRKNK